LPFEAFEVALIVRAVVLVICVAAWLRTLAPEPAASAVQPVPEVA
jgi:hypothetical protein